MLQNNLLLEKICHVTKGFRHFANEFSVMKRPFATFQQFGPDKSVVN